MVRSYHKFSKQEIDYVKEHFANKSNKELGRDLNLSDYHIEYILKKSSLKRDIDYARPSKYSKSIVHEYFSILSHDMAYILGFLTADGNIYKNSLQICLSQQDLCILEKIRDEICPGKHIHCRTRPADPSTGYISKVCILHIHSKRIIDDLNVFGIIPQKTGKEILPDLPTEFFGDWLRGFFDGDGCCTCHTVQNKYLNCHAKITSSSKSLLSKLKDITNIGRIYKNKSSWDWQMMSKKELQIFFDIIYKDRDVLHNRFCLLRKREKFNAKCQ